MFKLFCKYPNWPETAKRVCFADKLASKEQAETLQNKLAKIGYTSFKITEYTPTIEKRGTNKSNAIKAFYSHK